MIFRSITVHRELIGRFPAIVNVIPSAILLVL